MMDKINRLSHIQLDVLREVGNIGAGNAATSMSELIQKKIDMQVPSVNIIPFEDVMEWLGGSETTVAGIMIHLYGDVPGKVYFILSISEAETLVKHMTNQSDVKLTPGEKATDNMTVSALTESGNIMAGSYLSALSDFTGLHLQPSVPYLTIDMAGAVLSHALIEVSHITDYAMIIDTEIKTVDSCDDICGNFLFLPDPDAFTQLFKSLGIEEND